MAEEGGIALEEIESGRVPVSLPIAHKVAAGVEVEVEVEIEIEVGVEVVIGIPGDDDETVNRGMLATLVLWNMKFAGRNGRTLTVGEEIRSSRMIPGLTVQIDRAVAEADISTATTRLQ